jgi:hypothetical protein
MVLPIPAEHGSSTQPPRSIALRNASPARVRRAGAHGRHVRPLSDATMPALP